MINPAFLRKADAAKFLSISPRTLTNWQRKGILSYSKPCRRVVLFAKTDLERAMARFRVDAVLEGRP
jgi:hypothetical protein